MIRSGTREFRNKMTTGDHPNYIIFEIGKNTKKSPEDLMRHAFTINDKRKNDN